MVELFANSGDPDQTLHSVASDLGLHCLSITRLGVSRLQWVKKLHNHQQVDAIQMGTHNICFYKENQKN